LSSLTIFPWVHYPAGEETRLWLFPGWIALPIGMLAMFGSVAVALFSRHRASLIVMTAVVLSVAFTGVYAAVLISRYDDGGSFYGGPTNMVVPFPGLGGPLAILAALLGATAAGGAYRLARRPTKQQSETFTPKNS
jgi:hypothetical protein